MLTDYSRCSSCGAITIFAEDGTSYSCKSSSKKRFMPGVDLRRLRKLENSYCCNYCVNHWGLDLCACGSGKRFDKCKNGMPECGRPSQELMRYDHVVGSDLLARMIG